MAANRPISYNKPNRRQALFEIRRLIIEEGLSHQEIQLRLSIPARTYFNWLDLLFKAEQEAIEGNNYTYQRLLNETLILNQRYLRRARKLTEIADDEKIQEAKNEIEAAERKIAELTKAKKPEVRDEWDREEIIRTRLSADIARTRIEKEKIELHKLLNHENEIIRAGAEQEYKKYLNRKKELAERN